MSSEHLPLRVPSRPQLSTLAPSTSRSASSSPTPSPTSSFASLLHPSNSAESLPTTTASSTARFHEALAANSVLRHHHSSSSSSASSSRAASDDFGLLPPSEAASPFGAKSFDALQRELVGNSGLGVMGSGLGDADDDARFFDEPDEYEGKDSQDGHASAEDHQGGIAQTLAAAGFTPVPTPVPASALADDDEDDDAAEAEPSEPTQTDDESKGFGFLLHPPPSSKPPGPTGDPFMTIRQHTSAAPDSPSSLTRSLPSTSTSATSTPKLVRERTFPAPLLLSSDRPFAITAPLSLPRKASVSAGTSPGTSVSGSPSPSSRVAWLPSASMPAPSSSYEPPPAPLPVRPRQHRYQHSSQSSITYTHSNTSTHSTNPSLSSNLSSNASPLMGASSTFSSTSSSSHMPTSSSSSATFVQPDPPIAPQALLLHVLSLRSASAPMALSQSQGPLSRSATPLFSQQQTHQRIRSAGSAAIAEGSLAASENETSGSSGSKLDTVDLSHKKIAEVPIEVIEELKDETEKLALGYNLLRELPEDFGMLGNKLRYLNVRVNLLTIFPAVLCDMPSLEILDISRNKIKKMPALPGTLLNLKVFSIAKNRIRRLPTYVAQMTHLKMLRIDHNPLEWPPKDITTIPTLGGGSTNEDPSSKQRSKADDTEEMQKWLPALQRWIRENSDWRGRRASLITFGEDDLPPVAAVGEEPSTPSASVPTLPRSNAMIRTDSGKLVLPPTTNTSTPSSTRSRVSPSPGRGPSLTLEDDPTTKGLHSRNASHSQAIEDEGRPLLRSKKSLPDLRQPHADILAERRHESDLDEDRPRGRQSPAGTPPALRKFKLDKSSHSANAVMTLQTSTPSRAPSPGPSDISPSTVVARSPDVTPSKIHRRAATPTSARIDFDLQDGRARRVGDMDRTSGFDRNSGAYFRRLSMLPASTISKAVPSSLLQFADAIRGILFSLSQIYAALRQFVVFASQDRLPGRIAKLMASADSSTSTLINALDRFDSLSRRGTPSTDIVKDVFVTCKENVATFGQLVAALKPELKALISTADIRYTRTLLLMLYGSTGEIAKSWEAVVPMLEEMSLDDEDPSLTRLILQPPTPSPKAESPTMPTKPIPGRPRSKSRRHAGSFSVEDVELGAVLPPAPYNPNPNFAPGPAPYSPLSTSAAPSFPSGPEYAYDNTLRAKNGKSSLSLRPNAPNSISLPAQPPRSLYHQALDQPLTPGGTGWASHLADLAPPEFGTGPRGSPVPGVASFASTPRIEMRAVPTASADQLFINMVDPTTSIAYDVYATILDSFDEARDPIYDEQSGVLLRELGPKRTKELQDICIYGNEATVKLTASLARMLGPEGMRAPHLFTSAEAKRLGDDAYTFVQSVIRLGKMVKAMSHEHRFSPRIRDGVGQLTIATKDFAKHLTATSFRPQVPASASSSSSSTPSSMFALRS